MATRAERYAEGKFANPLHPKDGYSLPECMDPRARRVLEFLVPILYPEKLARVTVAMGNTIFGAYTGEREVDWAMVIWDVVRRLLTGVDKSKPTPICPYLLHLYIAHDVVQADDKKVYIVGKSFMRHEVDPDEEEESSGSESSERESLTSNEIRELQQQKEKEASPPRHKVTSTSIKKDKAPQVEETVEEPRKRNPFQVIADSLNEIRERCVRTRKVVWSTCAVVGAEGEDTLVETLKELPQRQTVLDLESKNAKLKEEVKKLKKELEDERKANSIAVTKLGESMELIRKMEGVVQQSADILNKAKLFDAGLAKNLVTAAKVIPVLVNFYQKMDELLINMRALFEGLEVSGLVPLNQVPNISINTEELPTL